MPDDSVSDITDLEEEEILAKYYRKKLTIVTEKRHDSQKRLDSQGSQPDLDQPHKCKKKRETEEERQKRFLNETIELELQQP